MRRDQVLKYVKQKYGVEPDFPFPGDFESAVLRHKDTEKWFALLMYVSADKIGGETKERLSIMNVKAEPMLIDSLVDQSGFHRAYHMNKCQWITVELSNQVSEELTKSLIDMSYDMTGRRKK